MSDLVINTYIVIDPAANEMGRIDGRWEQFDDFTGADYRTRPVHVPDMLQFWMRSSSPSLRNHNATSLGRYWNRSATSSALLLLAGF